MLTETYPAKRRYTGQDAAQYEHDRVASAQWRKEHAVVEQVVRSLPGSTVILDIPVGTGRFLQLYSAHKHVAYGLDVSRDMLSLAKAKTDSLRQGAVQGLVQGEAERIPFGSETIDYVVCNRFINWIPPGILEHVISDFCRVARRGMVLEVRVREKLGLLAFLWHIPRLLMRTARLLHKGGITGGIVGKRRAAGAGYFLHDARLVQMLFMSKGLVVQSVIDIETGISIRKRELRPLRIYVVHKVGAS